jgi:lipopolysaccharide export system permease protein
MNKQNLPLTFGLHIIREFLISLGIIFFTISSLVIITNFVEELLFLKELNFNKNLYIFSLIYTLLKTPSIILNLFPYIFLFGSIHFFVKIINNNEYLSLKINGLSNFIIVIIPSFFSFLLGILILLIFSPVASEMTKYYEGQKKNLAGNDNLLIVNDEGIWIKEEKKNNEIIIFKSSNLKNFDNNIILENLIIYNHNQKGLLTKTIISDYAISKKDFFILKNAEVHNSDFNQKEKFKEIVYETQIDLKKLENFFSNPDTYSIWNIINNLKSLKSRGYNGDELIIKLNKYLSLPFLVFSTVILSTIFTINSKRSYTNNVYAMIGVFSGIILYFFSDLSIALGKSGKIPLYLSVWMPGLLILLISIFSLLRKDEQ